MSLLLVYVRPFDYLSVLPATDDVCK